MPLRRFLAGLGARGLAADFFREPVGRAVLPQLGVGAGKAGKAATVAFLGGFEASGSLAFLALRVE